MKKFGTGLEIMARPLALSKHHLRQTRTDFGGFWSTDRRGNSDADDTILGPLKRPFAGLFYLG